MDDHCKCEHKHHLKPSPELEPLGLWNSYPYEGAFLKLYTPVYVRMCIQRESKQLHTNTDCMPPVHCRRQTSKCCTKWFLYLERVAFWTCCHYLLGQQSYGCTLSWPPTSQTVKLMFLYSTVSTLKPDMCHKRRKEKKSSE